MSEASMWDAWVPLAEAGRFEDAIEAFIEAYDHVSFAELRNRFGSYMEVAGRIAITMPNDPNILLWAEMSQVFADAVSNLLRDQRILPEPANPLVYFFDGGALRLPVVKRITKTPRKKEGWLPVTLRIHPDRRIA
jgi:hypothetical protein